MHTYTHDLKQLSTMNQNDKHNPHPGDFWWVSVLKESWGKCRQARSVCCYLVLLIKEVGFWQSVNLLSLSEYPDYASSRPLDDLLISILNNWELMLVLLISFSGRITAETSLFYYKLGKDHSTYEDLTFMASDAQPHVTNHSIHLCDEIHQCVYDFTTTGDKAFANATRLWVEMFEQALDDVKPGNSSQFDVFVLTIYQSIGRFVFVGRLIYI